MTRRKLACLHTLSMTLIRSLEGRGFSPGLALRWEAYARHGGNGSGFTQPQLNAGFSFVA